MSDKKIVPPETIRPSAASVAPDSLIEELIRMFAAARDSFHPFAARLRPLDRKRLRGVGIKRQGFIERAYSYAVENPQFLPQYLTIEKFREDMERSVNMNVLFDLCKQMYEYVGNKNIEYGDTSNRNALAFYVTVRDAAKHRRDGAQTIYRDLKTIFRHGGTKEERPTKKKVKRNADALLHGKRDGKIVIENVKPKADGGRRKVIDEQFNDNEQYKNPGEEGKNP
jgi:hypothetical protein